jgi:hypothetical protein
MFLPKGAKLTLVKMRVGDRHERQIISAGIRVTQSFSTEDPDHVKSNHNHDKDKDLLDLLSRELYAARTPTCAMGTLTTTRMSHCKRLT